MDLAYTRSGASKERIDAQTDVLFSCKEYGLPILIEVRKETDISRDLYNSVKSRPTTTTQFNTYSFPTIYSPTTPQMEKAGIREKTEIILYLPKLDFDNNSLSILSPDFNRCTLIINGAKYEIKDKALNSHFLDDFLYITIGVNKI
jgi:hypothetical protein